ncbi:methyltransferase domain-containing protein [Candidatus Uabimicrobium sp. HlEnr_7]|uniref:class I SAM-dependent methyltransferase n=1 Tax=Candidatus Uabimicrobium helgolandensis TaxID=3095367 RepID=UPI003556727E
MDLIESNQLVNEQEHWWTKTRFCYIERAIKLLSKKRQSILEVGCGTCQNLAFLRTKERVSGNIERVVGFDPGFIDPPTFSWRKTNDLFVKTLENSSQESFDLLLAMDVLEHLDNDVEHLQNWLRYLKKDSLVLITVPAFECLWSYHDELLFHKRRYTKKTLRNLASQVGLEPLMLTYAFGHIFLPAFFIRKILAPFAKQKKSTDLQESHFLLNKALYSLGKIEALFGGNPLFGTSVIGIFTYANRDSNSLL